MVETELNGRFLKLSVPGEEGGRRRTAAQESFVESARFNFGHSPLDQSTVLTLQLPPFAWVFTDSIETGHNAV